jgi:hypothetical protein
MRWVRVSRPRAARPSFSGIYDAAVMPLRMEIADIPPPMNDGRSVIALCPARCQSRLEEGQEVGVDRFGLRGDHAVRESLVCL